MVLIALKLGSRVVFSTIKWATDKECCTVKEGLYGTRVQLAARIPAVSSQLCLVVVSMVGQLLYWLGCWL